MISTGRVVVGVTDHGGEAALVYAAAEARRRESGVRVVLLHPDPATISCTLADLTPLGPARCVEERLGDAARVLVDAGIAPDDVTTEVAHGSPATSLVARSGDALTLVLEHAARGAVGDPASFRLVCAVAARARCPVVAVPATWHPGAEAATVRVGVVGATASREVVRAALAECSRRGAHLQLVHGWDAPWATEARGRHGERVRAAHHRNELLTGLRDIILEHGHVPVGVEAPHQSVGGSLVGDPSVTALVVMGRHHDATTPAGDLGPNVRSTIRWSPVPVLVVDPAGRLTELPRAAAR